MNGFLSSKWVNPYQGLLGTVSPSSPGLGQAQQASQNPPHYVPPGYPEPKPAGTDEQYHINNNPMYSLLKMHGDWTPSQLQGPNPHDPTTDPGGPNAPTPEPPAAPPSTATGAIQTPQGLQYQLWHVEGQPERAGGQGAARLHAWNGSYYDPYTSGARDRFGNVAGNVVDPATGGQKGLYEILGNQMAYRGAPVHDWNNNLLGYYGGDGGQRYLSEAEALEKGFITRAGE